MEEEKKGDDTTKDLVQSLNEAEMLELKAEAEKKRLDRSVLKIMKQADICLFCNL